MVTMPVAADHLVGLDDEQREAVLAARGPTPARYAAGTAFLAALLLLAGAAPWLLPAAYVSWAAVCLPWRAVAFHKKKWTAFLLDFCYVRAGGRVGRWRRAPGGLAAGGGCACPPAALGSPPHPPPTIAPSPPVG